MKRDRNNVRIEVENALENNSNADFDYTGEGYRSICLDGWFSLAELKAVIAAIESVPLE